MKNIFIFMALSCIMAGCNNDDYKEDFLLETLFEKNDKRLLDYFSINEEDKILFWSEEFENNDSKWPIDITTSYTDAKAFIEGGSIIIDYYGESRRVFFDLPISIDESKNFELEMRTYWQSPTAYLYSFNNPKDTTNFYALFLRDNDGIIDLSFDEIRDEWDGWRNLIDIKEPLSFVAIEDYNLTTIRKIGSKFSVFVNGIYIYTIVDERFSCNPTSFSISQGINKLDYFRVSHLKDNDEI